MSEWLIHCTDGLKSGAYYASVDIHDGEQPVMILFRKDGEKTFVVGQGEPVNPHGSLIDVDSLKNNDAFHRLLRFINTAVDKQMKGIGGGEK